MTNMDVLIPLIFGLVAFSLIFSDLTATTPTSTTTKDIEDIASLTSPTALNTQVRQWLQDNPAPDTGGIPTEIRQLQTKIFADYMATIARPPLPQNDIDPHIKVMSQINKATIANAASMQAAANHALSEAIRRESEKWTTN